MSEVSNTPKEPEWYARYQGWLQQFENLHLEDYPELWVQPKLTRWQRLRRFLGL